MNGKIYPIADTYVIQDIEGGKKYVVRIEDSYLPYIVGSDVEFTLNESGMAIISKCETIAEIHNIPVGWIL